MIINYNEAKSHKWNDELEVDKVEVQNKLANV